MVEIILWLLWPLWPLIIVSSYYLGVPLLIRSQQRYPAHLELMELDFEELDPEIAKFLRMRTVSLLALGFDEPTLVQTGTPSVSAFLLMLVNRQTGDKAMVTALIGRASVLVRTLFVEFSTRFENGQVFDTSNSSELGAFPPSAMTIRTKVSSVKDPHELFELHQYVMKKHGASGKKVLYEPGKALDWMNRFVLQKTYDDQVKRGWLYYDEGGDCYRTTLKGVYLITWGLLQPFKAMRQWAMRRRQKKVLAEFDRARGWQEKEADSET